VVAAMTGKILKKILGTKQLSEIFLIFFQGYIQKFYSILF